MLVRSIMLGAAVAVVGSTVGCSSIRPTSQAVVPGTDTRAEVLARVGRSPFVWFDQDGRENWDYGGNPFSAFAYRATFDDAGKLLEWRQLRRRQDMPGLEVGKSTIEDVQRAFGQPQQLYFIRGDAHWQWRVDRLSGPFRLVAQIAPDGTLKALGEYPLERCCGGGMP